MENEGRREEVVRGKVKQKSAAGIMEPARGGGGGRRRWRGGEYLR